MYINCILDIKRSEGVDILMYTILFAIAYLSSYDILFMYI